MKERGIVKLTLSGREISLRVPLKLAIQIESDTGKGLVELVRQGGTGALPLLDCLKIIGATLAENGEHWEHDELMAAVEDIGIMKAMLMAAEILNIFFEVPKSHLAKKAKAPDSNLRNSH